MSIIIKNTIKHFLLIIYSKFSARLILINDHTYEMEQIDIKI